MRRKTVRNGLRLVTVCMVLIMLVSFYHEQIATLLSLSSDAEGRLYSLGIFWASAAGGYGVVLITLGLILSSRAQDAPVRLTPWVIGVLAVMVLFVYLTLQHLNNPEQYERKRLSPGETITI